ncbi:hypothetical protein DAEQUDRAFT_768883 [Daedalea quercina L-15889]|uniref:Uncharacterized protein n=1 Tax=Daedalea quercina L-15889 TaxID=1314783 RepID=A0A165MA33_9APHY|nr:hypothetical protein DAEQUDRAFT_768883 [Daedalea quercina L-15889]
MASIPPRPRLRLAWIGASVEIEGLKHLRVAGMFVVCEVARRAAHSKNEGNGDLLMVDVQVMLDVCHGPLGVSVTSVPFRTDTADKSVVSGMNGSPLHSEEYGALAGHLALHPGEIPLRDASSRTRRQFSGCTLRDGGLTHPLADFPAELGDIATTQHLQRQTASGRAMRLYLALLLFLWAVPGSTRNGSSHILLVGNIAQSQFPNALSLAGRSRTGTGPPRPSAAASARLVQQIVRAGGRRRPSKRVSPIGGEARAMGSAKRRGSPICGPSSAGPGRTPRADAQADPTNMFRPRRPYVPPHGRSLVTACARPPLAARPGFDFAMVLERDERVTETCACFSHAAPRNVSIPSAEPPSVRVTRRTLANPRRWPA